MKKVLIPVLAFAFPVVAFAQLGNVEDLLDSFQRLLGIIVPILIGLAVVVFMWGVVKFIANAGDEDARKEAKSTMIWGIIGIVVMVSIWGLVEFVQEAFDIDSSGNAVETPELPDTR